MARNRNKPVALKTVKPRDPFVEHMHQRNGNGAHIKTTPRSERRLMKSRLKRSIDNA